ncbi:hypothetical protein ACH498_25115 [Rhodococcus erythropolis]
MATPAGFDEHPSIGSHPLRRIVALEPVTPEFADAAPADRAGPKPPRQGIAAGVAADEAEGVRVRDVEVGCTYVVLVPHRLPAALYPERGRPGTPAWIASWLAGTRFRFTVTSIDHDTDPVTAEGLRFTERAYTDITLTDNQATALGLEPGHGYHVAGTLLDRDGNLTYLPAVDPIRIPVRWLHPTDDPRLPQSTHRDADHWPYA